MNSSEVVYIVECFGRGPTRLSRNITKDREGIQKYIDKVLNERDNYVDITGNSPDHFLALAADESYGGIHIYSKPVIDKFENIDLLRLLERSRQ